MNEISIDYSKKYFTCFFKYIDFAYLYKIIHKGHVENFPKI